MDSHALEITELRKRYPTGTEALKGVSLTIEAGKFFGHDAIDHYTEARTAVGLAPQDLNLDWFLTVAESLDYHAGYFGMPKKERRERTEELLETFSLTDKRHERT